MKYAAAVANQVSDMTPVSAEEGAGDLCGAGECSVPLAPLPLEAIAGVEGCAPTPGMQHERRRRQRAVRERPLHERHLEVGGRQDLRPRHHLQPVRQPRVVLDEQAFHRVRQRAVLGGRDHLRGRDHLQEVLQPGPRRAGDQVRWSRVGGWQTVRGRNDVQSLQEPINFLDEQTFHRLWHRAVLGGRDHMRGRDHLQEVLQPGPRRARDQVRRCRVDGRDRVRTRNHVQLVPEPGHLVGQQVHYRVRDRAVLGGRDHLRGRDHLQEVLQHCPRRARDQVRRCRMDGRDGVRARNHVQLVPEPGHVVGQQVLHRVRHRAAVGGRHGLRDGHYVQQVQEPGLLLGPQVLHRVRQRPVLGRRNPVLGGDDLQGVLQRFELALAPIRGFLQLRGSGNP
jgi:hypothetical protein